MRQTGNEIDREEAHDAIQSLLATTIKQSVAKCKGDVVATALSLLMVRVANTWRSIRILVQHSPEKESVMVDAGVLLRVMIDAYLQAEYIFHQPERREERASAYIDYEHVERHRLHDRVLKNDNWFSNRLKASPRRPEGELRLQQEYDRVKSRYSLAGRKRGGTPQAKTTTRDRWYEGNLFEIAKTFDKDAEYDVFVAAFNGCVHSSALAIRQGPIVSAEHVVDLASIFSARVARLNVLHNQLDIGDVNNQLLELFFRNHLDGV